VSKQTAPFWWPDARGFVAAGVMFMAGTVLFYRMMNPSNTDDKVLDMMLTILFGTAFVAIINFLFGSSRGSDMKDETIGKIAMEPVPPPTPSPPVTTTTTSEAGKATTITEPTPGSAGV